MGKGHRLFIEAAIRWFGLRRFLDETGDVLVELGEESEGVALKEFASRFSNDIPKVGLSRFDKEKPSG